MFFWIEKGGESRVWEKSSFLFLFCCGRKKVDFLSGVVRKKVFLMGE